MNAGTDMRWVSGKNKAEIKEREKVREAGLSDVGVKTVHDHQIPALASDPVL